MRGTPAPEFDVLGKGQKRQRFSCPVEGRKGHLRDWDFRQAAAIAIFGYVASVHRVPEIQPFPGVLNDFAP
jgi:hypothetical protein